MAGEQGVAVSESRDSGPSSSAITPSRRLGALVVAGAMALLATACGSSLGWDTPCSTWVSMDSADQQSTISAINQQDGLSSPSSSDVSEFQRSAAAYCSDPIVNQPTIAGMLDSRAP
jgi:hypothetical protein